MKLFHKTKMEGSYWGVFLVNPNDNADRYLVSSAFDNERDAEDFAAEFNRIADGAASVDVMDSIPFLKLDHKRRIIIQD